MSGFSAQWLAMRERADATARNRSCIEALNRWLHGRLHGDAPANIIDLGCGSGSNLRWLAPRIDTAQHWQLIDNDDQLLDQAARLLRDWATVRTSSLQVTTGDVHALRLGEQLTVRLTQFDLSKQLPALGDTHLLSASALLDLVSRDWLGALIRLGARQQVGMLFALNYDGRVRFKPAHANDTMIRDAVNRDQYTDKGFGPALGPDCVAALASACTAHGYRVTQWRSDWRLGTDEQAMHARLVDDFAHIARRNLPSHAHQAIQAWQRWRDERLSASTLHVGHVDILALPHSAKSAATTRLASTS